MPNSFFYKRWKICLLGEAYSWLKILCSTVVILSNTCIYKIYLSRIKYTTLAITNWLDNHNLSKELLRHTNFFFFFILCLYNGNLITFLISQGSPIYVNMFVQWLSSFEVKRMFSFLRVAYSWKNFEFHLWLYWIIMYVYKI